MNLGQLLTEFEGRGFNHKDASRLTRWLNQSYLEICEYERWPFLEETVTGLPPLEIPNLMAVDTVRNNATHRTLYFEPRDTIFESGRRLEATGTPTRYYVDDGNLIKTWPVRETQQIRVHYWKVPDELGDENDEPLLPVRFHNLIVDGAVRRAYQDADAPERAEGVEAERRQGLELMAASLLRQYDPVRSPRHVETPA